MGNFISNTRYCYPYEKPSELNWQNYIQQCSIHYEEKLKELFSSSFKGKIVEWEGQVVKVHQDHVTFQMIPSDCFWKNTDLVLFTDPKLPPPSSRFTRKRVVKIRGILEAYGHHSNHELREVPMTENNPVNLSIPYSDYLFHFGLLAQRLANYNHLHYWNAKEITFSGKYTSVPTLQISKESTVPPNFYSVSFQPTYPQETENEPVQIEFSVKDKTAFKRIEREYSTHETVTVTATCTKRGASAHIFRLPPPLDVSDDLLLQGTEPTGPMPQTADEPPSRRNLYFGIAIGTTVAVAIGVAAYIKLKPL
ncbi:hypothetical protein BLNAU_2319 [Blattamonas nauphoetae]|uniref:Uncharacterized protein n=1 Tax=Blattamonas nauphoetae TaxID=2049346 RepID=A0ABQ9YH31_9EUKA|nr:hypothetical protein BLNAU_2319 [Blattamonas nauphoetae]